MYTPKAFAVTDLAQMHGEMQRSGLVTLVTVTGSGLVATHLPVLLEESQGEFGTISGHISRANSQWLESLPEGEALVIFAGPDAYVSPGWYPSKQETGRVVPTWNYAAIHAYGTPAFFSDAERLRDLVTRLTSRHESRFPAPWKPTDAPPVFIDAQLKAIVGFDMPIRRLEGKHKFNQNRSAEDRRGVIAGLKKTGEPNDGAVALFMERLQNAAE